MEIKKARFDSNAYSYLGKMILAYAEDKRQTKINQFKLCLAKKGIEINIHFFVICEKLCSFPAILTEEIERKIKMDLDIMCQLSLRNNEVHFEYPTDAIIAHKFEHKELENLYLTSAKKVAEVATNYLQFGKNDTFDNDIEEIKSYLNDYKVVLGQGLKYVIADLKVKGITEIPIENEHLHQLFLLSKIRAVLKIDIDTIDQNIVNDLLNINYFGLARALKVLAVGFIKENVDKGIFLNNFIDQAICENIAKNDNLVLVTSDGLSKEGIRTTFNEKGFSEKIMTLDEFMTYIDFKN